MRPWAYSAHLAYLAHQAHPVHSAMSKLDRPRDFNQENHSFSSFEKTVDRPSIQRTDQRTHPHREM